MSSTTGRLPITLIVVIASSVAIGWIAVGAENLLFAFMLLLVSLACLTAIHLLCPRPRELFWLSPIGLLLAYLACNGSCPVLWGIGWAAPWTETPSRSIRRSRVATLVLTCATLGVFIGMPKVTLHRASLTSPDGALTKALFCGLAIGLIGYAGLARAAAADVLLHSLSDRRDLLAGTGPYRILITVTAMACVYGVLHRDKTAAQRSLTNLLRSQLDGVLTLLTGSRFQAIVLVVAIVCAISRSVGVDRRS